MRTSQFLAYINADPEQLKVHNRSRVTKSGKKISWQTVSVDGKELTGFTLTESHKAARKRYRSNDI